MNKFRNTYSIGEVSKRLNVFCHTLRFWEKELGDILVPLRTKGGQRRYTEDHLFLVEQIKFLRSKGMSLAEIQARMTGEESDKTGNYEEIDRVAREIAGIVRMALQSFLQKQGL